MSNPRPVLVLLLLLGGPSMAHASEPIPILDFTDPAAVERFRPIDDVVMGGVSSSRLVHEDGVAVFEGTLSLERGGGFASVRSAPADLGVAGIAFLELEVRGDGRLYRVTLKGDDAFDGVFHHGTFEPPEGVWTPIRLPLEAFVPRFRGRLVRDAPALDPARIRQIGFMVSDRQAGEFRLEIRAVRGVR